MPDWFFRSLTGFELITWHALEGPGKRGGENEQDVYSTCPAGAGALRWLRESRVRAHSELVARRRTHLCCKPRHSGSRMAPCRAAFMRSRDRCYARPVGTASRRVDDLGFMTSASGSRTTRQSSSRAISPRAWPLHPIALKSKTAAAVRSCTSVVHRQLSNSSGPHESQFRRRGQSVQRGSGWRPATPPVRRARSRRAGRAARNHHARRRGHRPAHRGNC